MTSACVERLVSYVSVFITGINVAVITFSLWSLHRTKQIQKEIDANIATLQEWTVPR
jgi:hypothetical protein